MTEMGNLDASSIEPLNLLDNDGEHCAPTPPPPGHACELCGEALADEHNHLVERSARTLACSCRACYLLFTPDGSGGRRYLGVPERYLSFPDFSLSPAQWDGLRIPAGVAFFLLNSELGRVAAFYPGTLGATEATLPWGAWAEVVAANPAVAVTMADVEAFLVRTGAPEPGAECFLVPIDACYELVGELRKRWQGLDGAAEAQESLDAFFDRVRTKAEPVGEVQ